MFKKNKNKNKNMDSRRWVEHVDQNEAECNEEDDSGGHNVLKELNKKEEEKCSGEIKGINGGQNWESSC